MIQKLRLIFIILACISLHHAQEERSETEKSLSKLAITYDRGIGFRYHKTESLAFDANFFMRYDYTKSGAGHYDKYIYMPSLSLGIAYTIKSKHSINYNILIRVKTRYHFEKYIFESSVYKMDFFSFLLYFAPEITFPIPKFDNIFVGISFPSYFDIRNNYISGWSNPSSASEIEFRRSDSHNFIMFSGSLSSIQVSIKYYLDD